MNRGGILKDFFIIDGHCDSLGSIKDQKADLYDKDKSQITIEGFKKGHVGLQFFAAWVGPKTKYSPCLQRGLTLIDTFYKMLELHREDFLHVLSFSDIQEAISKKKIGALLTVEGGDVLEGELTNVRILYRLGVRALTLTWNYRNEIADGVLETKANGGLSEFGYSLIKEMNELGILIDVSHISEKGFYDVIEASTKPIAATHSNAQTICSNKRNLTDKQIKLLAKSKGLIGINFYPNFLSNTRSSSDDIIKHIEYIASLVGVDVIGLGSDFDGIDKLPKDIKGPEDMDIIINKLLRLNYSETDVRKIAYLNYLRLLKRVLN